MGRLFHLFKHEEPEPEVEVETFDFEDHMFDVIGLCEELQHAEYIFQVKELVHKLVEQVADWPDDG